MSPHAPPLRGSLPPEGARIQLGSGPALNSVSPHASPQPGSLPDPAPDGTGVVPAKGFEGSYLGDRSVLRPGSRLECKICWWVYDPAEGDPQWQIPPGTPFADLPPRWRCPNCDGDAEQFLLLAD